MLVDAVARVTGVPEPLGDRPTGTTAGSLGDSRVPSLPLDLLGRCPREAGCDADASASGSLAVALHAINGPWLNVKIARPEGRLHRAIDAGRSDGEMIDKFYRVALGREPGDDERAHWTGAIGSAGPGDRTAALEDFLWALLGSAEFTHNH